MSWGQRVSDAREHLIERNRSAAEEFKIDEWERYDYDLDVGTLVFSHDDRARVVADILFVGSISFESDTWLWGWANPWIPEGVKLGLEPVRALGERAGFEKLNIEKWPAKEVDGWDVSAIAAEVLDAAAVYRAPSEDSLAFLLLFDLRWVGE